MTKETLLLENMEKKENHGFRNPCPKPTRKKYDEELNALLKC